MSTFHESAGSTHPIGSASLFAHIFISYASEDRKLALWLNDALLEAGVADVWLDREDIVGGDHWNEQIKTALLKSNILLALITEDSIRSDRDHAWIHYEHREAERLLRRIIPLLFVPAARLPDNLRRYQGIDFTNVDVGFKNLRETLARIVLRNGRLLADQSPPLTDGFVGREKELRDLVTLVEDEGERSRVESGRRAIAIQGMGGMGKTMVANEFVRRLASRYPGGLLLETRGQKPASVPSVLRRWAELALGHTSPRDYLPNEIRALLARCGELLVLLDDVSDKHFEETQQLLNALPPDATRIITTRSLEAATELGCVIYELGRLPVSDAVDLLRDRFICRPGLKFTEAEFQQYRSAVDELVERLGGHALALELAATWCASLKHLPELVTHFVESLNSGVGALGTKAYKITKDNSVAASFQISLDELRKYDQRMGTDWVRRFVELGVFTDGARMDPEMTFAVWKEPLPLPFAAKQTLQFLNNRALVKLEADEYTVHPLLQAYAYQLLKASDSELQITDRFITHVIERAKACFDRPPHEWNRFEIIFPHIRSVGDILYERVAKCLGDPEQAASFRASDGAQPALDPTAVKDISTALEYARAVLEFVIRRNGAGNRGRRVLCMGIACARALGLKHNERDEMVFLRALGGWHARRDPPTAFNYFEAALNAARQLGDRVEEAKTLSYLGEVERMRSRFSEARQRLEEALRIYRSVADKDRDHRMVATTLKYLGETNWRMTRYGEASRCYDESLSIARRIGDRGIEGDLINKIGSVEFEKGNLISAIERFNEALSIHREVSNRTGEAEDLNDMGISHIYLERFDEAERYLLLALEIHRELGNRGLEAVTLSNLAAMHLARKEFASASEAATQCLTISREVEARLTECWALNHQGVAQRGFGRADRALEYLQAALAIARGIDNPRTLAGTLGNLAELLGENPERGTEARALAVEAVRILRECGIHRAFGGRTLEELQAMVNATQ